MILGIWATWVRFDLPQTAALMFTAASIYLLCAGMAHQVLAPRPTAQLGQPGEHAK